MVSVALFPCLGKGKQDPLPGPSACGRLGAADSVRVSAPERRVPWEEDRVRGRFVLRFRVGESAVGCTGAESQGRKEVRIN